MRQVERRLRQRVGQNRPNQPDPGQRQVIEGDVEERINLRDCAIARVVLARSFDFIANRGRAVLAMRVRHRRDARATEEGLPRGAFGGGQEPVAVLEALQRVEQVEFRLRFLLHPFGFGEERRRLRRAGRTGARHPPLWCELAIRWNASPLWSA